MYKYIYTIIVVVTIIVIVLLLRNNPLSCKKENLENQIVDAPIVEYSILMSPTVSTGVAKVNRIVFMNHNDIKTIRLIVHANLFDIQDEKYKIVLFGGTSAPRSFDMIQKADRFEMLYSEPFEKSNLTSFPNVKLMYRDNVLMSGKFT
jgi:hypothetical protein